MQTSLVFDFLSAQNLLVPFLKQNKVLQDLEKEELLILVEKLLDPPTQKTDVEKMQVNNPTICDNTLKYYNANEVLEKLKKDNYTSLEDFTPTYIDNIAVRIGMLNRNTDNSLTITELGEELKLRKNEKYIEYSEDSYDLFKEWFEYDRVENKNLTIKRTTIDNMLRTKTIKLSLQETYDRLVSEGITNVYASGKQLVNKVAVELGLINKRYIGKYNKTATYRPTMLGKQHGITPKGNHAVWYSLEAYEIIKEELLKQH